MATENEKVTIVKKEYDDLIKDQHKLRALEAGGVDNWDGYEWSMEDYATSVLGG